MEACRKAFLYRRLSEYGKEIFRSENFKKTRGYIQHGNRTVYRHSVDVAAWRLAENWGFAVRREK